MLKNLGFLIEHTQKITLDNINKDLVLLDSIMFRLIQISENSERLNTSFKSNHTDIPWRAIKGMRNKIIHQYGDIDLTVIYETVKNDIPNLYKLLNNIQ
ncbi:MAG: DUF86 domain-containing protein [Clostridia bacterium]|nr:DUF86 domain-containing protein [Clostridia bacterium]